jgi:hypothetical protein
MAVEQLARHFGESEFDVPIRTPPRFGAAYRAARIFTPDLENALPEPQSSKESLRRH